MARRKTTSTTPTRSTYLPADAAFGDPARADADRPDEAHAVIIPFGLEASVSYGGGTSRGPQAILDASHQLELFDPEFWREPYRAFGIATLPEPKIAKGQVAALAQLEALVETVVASGKVPFVLGGEHALTAGAVRPLVARHPDLVVLQFDAHWDLRDGYQGEPFSHAAAMRRVLDLPGVTLVSVGIRAFCREEADFYEANKDRIHVHFAKDMARWWTSEIMRPLRGRPVYITFDIDALDAHVMPATGTPVPGGLSYPQALDLVRAGCDAAGSIVGMDLVEFAPIDGFHAYDFTAAELAAKMLAYGMSVKEGR
jgi:agmatinase